MRVRSSDITLLGVGHPRSGFHVMQGKEPGVDKRARFNAWHRQHAIREVRALVGSDHVAATVRQGLLEAHGIEG
jgi:hypothetical protein